VSLNTQPKRKCFPGVENQSEEIQSEPAPMQRMATTKNSLKQTGELFGGITESRVSRILEKSQSKQEQSLLAPEN